MSDVIAQFDPTATTSGKFATSSLSTGIGKLVIWNDSAETLSLTFPNGDTDIAPAWVASIFELNGPARQVQWAQNMTVNATTPDLSQVWVIAYRDNEKIPGVFPIALTKQTKSGGGAVSSTNTLTLSNTGAPLNTNVAFASPSGDAGPAWSVDNAGNEVLGDAAHGGSLTIQGPGGLLQMLSTLGTPDVEVKAGNTIVTGATSGTATLYEVLRGSGLRVVTIYFNNFENNSGAAQLHALLSSFNSAVLVWASNVPNLQLTLGGFAQTLQVLTSLAVGGGTTTGATTLKSHSLAEVGPIDSVSYSASDASAHTGILVLIGI